MPLPDGKQTYYEFFGLENFENDAVKIKTSYRAMALKWHPDRNKDKTRAEYMMKQVNVIYMALSEDKENYDRHLKGKLNRPGEGIKNHYKKYGRSPVEELFESCGFSYGFTDTSGYSTTFTRGMTKDLQRKLRIKKLMDSLTDDELTMVENFLTLLHLQEKRG